MTIAPIAPTWALAALLIIGVVMLAGAVARRRWEWARRGLLFVMVALAGSNPIIGQGTAPTGSSNADIVFVVDTTPSAAAEDFGNAPRLDGMQADMRAIVARFAGARFAMVTSDRTARAVLPVTDDADAAIAAIDGLLPELAMYSAGSRTDEAVDVLDEMLDGDRDRATLLIYLGDGEDMGGRSDPGRFDKLRGSIGGGAVLGYGTQAGGAMRATTATSIVVGDYLTTDNGERVRSRIDERALRATADALDVPYSHRTPGSGAPEVSDDGDSGDRFGGIGTSTDVDRGAYWLLAMVAGALLLIELALLVRPLRDAPDLPGARR